MIKYLGLFRFLFLLIIPSCKETMNDADNIYFSYSLAYDENTDKTLATASFYEALPFGKSNKMDEMNCLRARKPLALPAGSSVSFNGTELEHPKKYQYSHEYSGFIKGGIFSWKDINGNKLVNKLPAPERIGMPPVKIFNKNFALCFKFNGEALKKQEFIDLYITDSHHNKFYASASADKPGIITYPVNQTYADGFATFELRRQLRIVKSENGKAVGEITVFYQASAVKVNIVSLPEQSDPAISFSPNPQ